MLEIRQNLEKEVRDRKMMTEQFCVQNACSDKMERLLSATSKNTTDTGFFSQKTSGCKYLTIVV